MQAIKRILVVTFDPTQQDQLALKPLQLNCRLYRLGIATWRCCDDGGDHQRNRSAMRALEGCGYPGHQLPGLGTAV